MALRSPGLPRKAPRTGSPSPQFRAWSKLPTGLEDDGLEEVEEPVEVTPEPAPALPARITVDGIPVKRLQIDFGSNATAFTPTGSVMERFWDQYDGDPDKDKFSRPRVFCYSKICVKLTGGFLDLTVHWDDGRGVTRLVQPHAHVSYET